MTLLLRGLKDLPAEERPRAGEQLNQLRHSSKKRWTIVSPSLNKQAGARAERRAGRHHLPGTRWERGSTHPLTLVIDEIIDVFSGHGF